jgi:hypothetical protein
VTKFHLPAFRGSARARAISQIARAGRSFSPFRPPRAWLAENRGIERSSACRENGDLRNVRAKVLRWAGLPNARFLARWKREMGLWATNQAPIEHGFVEAVRVNATSNPRCAICLVANNSYSASVMKQSPWRLVAHKSRLSKCTTVWLRPACGIRSPPTLLGELTQFTEDAHKVFDEIGNNRTTTIDHIISKTSIRIIVLEVELHHKGTSGSS